MAIEVAGKRFVTLADEFFVNGSKVYEAWANGVKVYPEREQRTYLAKFNNSETLEVTIELPILFKKVTVRNRTIDPNNYWGGEGFEVARNADGGIVEMQAPNASRICEWCVTHYYNEYDRKDVLIMATSINRGLYLMEYYPEPQRNQAGSTNKKSTSFTYNDAVVNGVSLYTPFVDMSGGYTFSIPKSADQTDQGYERNSLIKAAIGYYMMYEGVPQDN